MKARARGSCGFLLRGVLYMTAGMSLAESIPLIAYVAFSYQPVWTQFY